MSGNWMDDPAVSQIDKTKLQFLQALVFESQSLKKEQMMPFLMSIAKRGSDQHISFNSEEIETITATIRKYSSSEELDKIDKLMKLWQRPNRLH